MSFHFAGVVIFWVCLGLVFYTWIFYPAALLSLGCFFRREVKPGQNYFPQVVILIAAHNEEETIARRIENCLQLDYPPEKMEILVVSDCSTDRTAEVVRSFDSKRVRLLETTSRGGKSAAQNWAISHVSTEIVVLTDADAAFDCRCVAELVKNFADPNVGFVTGEMTLRADGRNPIAHHQGWYWRFEVLLRRLQSELGWLCHASGLCSAFRRRLFRPLSAHIGDDFGIPLDIVEQGYRVVHESKAIAYGAMPSTLSGELSARTRMCSRAWHGLWTYRRLWNPFRFPGVAWTMLSHKVMRFLTPFFLVALFLASWLLVGQRFYRFAALAQTLFYFLALMGYYLAMRGLPRLFLAAPFSFCLANLGFFMGVVKAVRGSRITAYDKQA